MRSSNNRRSALDEEDRSIRVARRSPCGANRIRALADPQRLVAGHEVHVGRAALQRTGQLLGIEPHRLHLTG
jgi:hypothetical protein